MLYRFQSHATPDLLMLEPVGRQVLKIWGKNPDTAGILLVSDMPQAVAQLRAAVAEEEAQAQRRRQASHEAEATEATPHDTDEAEAPSAWAAPLPLRVRVVPLLEVLQRCMDEGADLVWGL